MFNKVVYVCSGFVCACLFLFMSCSAVPVAKPTPSALSGIGTETQQVADASTTLKKTTATIKTEATQGMAQTPAAAAPTLNPHWNSILTQAGTQDQLASQLDATKVELDTTKGQVTTEEGQISTLTTKLSDATSSATKATQAQYRAYSGILFFAALAAVGTCVLLKGNIYAAGAAAVLGVGCLVCIFIVQALTFIVWIIVALLVAIIGLGVYAIIKNWKTLSSNLQNINIFKKAATQAVKTTEASKAFMTVAGRKAVFGDGAVPGLAHFIQDDETQDVVDTVRRSIEKAPSVPGKVASDFRGVVSSSTDSSVTQVDVNEAKTSTIKSNALDSVAVASNHLVNSPSNYTITATASKIEILFN